MGFIFALLINSAWPPPPCLAQANTDAIINQHSIRRQELRGRPDLWLHEINDNDSLGAGCIRADNPSSHIPPPPPPVTPFTPRPPPVTPFTPRPPPRSLHPDPHPSPLSHPDHHPFHTPTPTRHPFHTPNPTRHPFHTPTPTRHPFHTPTTTQVTTPDPPPCPTHPFSPRSLHPATPCSVYRTRPTTSFTTIPRHPSVFYLVPPTTRRLLSPATPV
ncbi:hypothetical protein Pcinc_035953 [Petrolisthes cinctipes]|uniref:Uncharacterized protein n=1 Tax=Petrolisthes cinctipes TaxID=88211 RepID=A0AAE1EN31_PETCI|nr:hypothetical protein Pcinc_035953 [Petrolisthes cinctipes]